MTGGTAGPYAAVRAATESIAAPLSAEDQTVQSMPDVSPTKWHRAHTTWFFETFVLAPHGGGYVPHHPGYGYLFNSYYELVGARYPRPARGLITRPGVAEVAEYRRVVDEAMLSLVETGTSPEVATLIELGLHHEQQHQELMLMDILHVLSVNPLRPVYCDVEPAATAATTPARWVEVEGGPTEIGHAADGFAFDNEGPRHTEWIEPHAIAAGLVTNDDWLAFIGDGGYERPELWLSDGWATVMAQGWTAPLYWTATDDGWSEFTLSGESAVDGSAPVAHVSHYEADAFARWSGGRLPTEAEWEHVITVHPDAIESAFGSVWQWTSSPYVAYPRYAPPSGAVGEYNAKFMSNQMVLRGSSVATPDDHTRATYRNFFPPAARWVFGGLRLAKDL